MSHGRRVTRSRRLCLASRCQCLNASSSALSKLKKKSARLKLWHLHARVGQERHLGGGRASDADRWSVLGTAEARPTGFRTNAWGTQCWWAAAAPACRTSRRRAGFAFECSAASRGLCRLSTCASDCICTSVDYGKNALNGTSGLHIGHSAIKASQTSQTTRWLQGWTTITAVRS